MQQHVAHPVTIEPAARPLGLWASYRAARRNILELIPKAAYAEPIVRGGRGTNSVLLMDPEGIERVLRTHPAAYPRSRTAQRMMSPRRGDNIVSATGEVWRSHRKAMSPMFQPRALAAHSPVMTAAAEVACERLRTSGGAGIDVFPVVMEATRDVICDLALSGDDVIDRDALTRRIDLGLRTVTRFSILDVLRVPNVVPRPGTLFNRARKRLDDMADSIATARRTRGPSTPPDMLDLMIAAEARGGMSRLDLRNNIVALLFAGHETTALAITWALYLLSTHPAVQEETAETARHVLSGRAATFDDLPGLTVVRQVVEEALRLYPPAGLVSRMAGHDDVLAGEKVRAGTTILVLIYALHRHEALWEAPNAFDPKRFAADARAQRSRFHYLPFGAGPRVCIGAEFALVEATIIVATLISRFRLTLTPGFAPLPCMWFTLRPATGLQIVADRRD